MSYLLQPLEAFRIGFFTVFETNYRWLLLGSGFALYLTMCLAGYAPQHAGVMFDSSVITYSAIVHFLFALVRIGIILFMIRLILLIFDHALKLKKQFSIFSENPDTVIKTELYLVKGFVLSLLIAIFPALLFGFLRTRTNIHPAIEKIIFYGAFVVSLMFFGFCCWILIDQGKSLWQSITQSIRCAMAHCVPLLLFYACAIIGMMLFDMVPYMQIIAYTIYFPIVLAAQGYLYRKLCFPHYMHSPADNIPFNRPPIS